MLEHCGQQGPGEGDSVLSRMERWGCGNERENAAEISAWRPGDFLNKAKFLVWGWGKAVNLGS